MKRVLSWVSLGLAEFAVYMYVRFACWIVNQAEDLIRANSTATFLLLLLGGSIVIGIMFAPVTPGGVIVSIISDAVSPSRRGIRYIVVGLYNFIWAFWMLYLFSAEVLKIYSVSGWYQIIIYGLHGAALIIIGANRMSSYDKMKPEEKAEMEKQISGKIICTECGKVMKKGDNFCSNCGNRIAPIDKEIKPAAKEKRGGKWEIWLFIVAAFIIGSLIYSISNVEIQEQPKKETTSSTQHKPKTEIKINKLEDTIVMQEAPKSSAFIEVGYGSNMLKVVFRKGGAAYIYYGVPESVWEEFINSDSLGRYFNTNIKGNYGYAKVE